MTLDVEPPEPPSLRDPQDRGDYEAIDMRDQQPTDDYRRETIAGFLAEGAWRDAFDEWAEHTYLTDAEFAIVLDLELIDGYDFYWDPASDDVGYRSPTLPEDVLDEYGSLEAADVEAIDGELDALGRVVSEVLENDYVLRDEGEAFGFFADSE